MIISGHYFSTGTQNKTYFYDELPVHSSVRTWNWLVYMIDDDDDFKKKNGGPAEQILNFRRLKCYGAQICHFNSCSMDTCQLNSLDKSEILDRSSLISKITCWAMYLYLYRYDKVGICAISVFDTLIIWQLRTRVTPHVWRVSTHWSVQVRTMICVHGGRVKSSDKQACLRYHLNIWYLLLEHCNKLTSKLPSKK